jgi:cytochrome c oxidase assembly factor CtaG
VSTPANARPKNRQVSRLARIGMIFFVIGLLAVAVIMVLFATGYTDLPLWLNLVAMLAPVGFGLGLVGVFVEARSSRRASALRRSGSARAGVT